MALSDIVGGFTKTYLYSNLARDVVKLWNRMDFPDLDKETLLRKVGVVPYEPGRRTAGDISFFLFGALVGAVLGLALAPKPGAELRSEVKDRALGLLDQARNRTESMERATA